MFGDRFQHYLSYGSTDQQTVRDLAGTYSGLLVPGTVASFQRDGTGGFVLSLSATDAAPPYAIDSRFPLFQQALPRAKKSHQALASLMGEPSLVHADSPDPSEFTPEQIGSICRNWLDFNRGYRGIAGDKFAKYAKRLGQDVDRDDSRSPVVVLAPYFVATGPTDPWWELSARFFEISRELADGEADVVRVVASTSAAGLDQLLSTVDDSRAAVWLSGLDELDATSDELELYARALNSSAARDTDLFALYGGFYSVLMSAFGLGGSSHGIGYGESRSWVELPESGPPPQRYYLPQLHRYVQPDEATRLYFADRQLAECSCAECGTDPPVAMEYHSLMKHSVRCRSAEIDSWCGLSPDEMASRLEHEYTVFRQILHRCDLADVAITRAERRAAHIPTWVDALRAAAS
jgi:hypothetical protein